jgi:uncharacterized protein (TIGR02996 family)
MVEEDVFHAALEEQPSASVTRLVFADWLEENGDWRAEGYRWLGKNGKWPIKDRHAKRLNGRWGYKWVRQGRLGASTPFALPDKMLDAIRHYKHAVEIMSRSLRQSEEEACLMLALPPIRRYLDRFTARFVDEVVGRKQPAQAFAALQLLLPLRDDPKKMWAAWRSLRGIPPYRRNRR